MVRPVNRTTTEELPAMQEWGAQLSEEEMQQIVGGSQDDVSVGVGFLVLDLQISID